MNREVCVCLCVSLARDQSARGQSALAAEECLTSARDRGASGATQGGPEER